MIKGTIVLEGGARRGIFTSGVLDFLMEQNLYFSDVIGVSFGACNASSYVSEQHGRMRDCTAQKENNLTEEIMPQTKGHYIWADVSRILPQACNEAFVEGMEVFGRQMKGFDRPDACLLGVESRTSSPVRIHRDDTWQSEIRGLYPCGEGAGYAGGITSAAMDGLRIAEAIASVYKPQNSR